MMANIRFAGLTNRIRVLNAANGQTTHFVIDANNPTGYAQVLEETGTPDTAPDRTYLIGQDVIAQASAAVANLVNHLVYDGHGSTRQVIDTVASILERYDYKAFGEAIGFAPAAALTTLLYAGEQHDGLLGWSYNRARYYDYSIGRFGSFDSYEGRTGEPLTLHKYLYTHANPIGGTDPSGMWTYVGVMVGATIGMVLASIMLPTVGAAYLWARGRLSISGVARQLGDGNTWLMAASGVLGGSAAGMLSQGMKGAVMKVAGEAAVKKMIPVVGLVFAAYALYQSIQLTWKMLTDEMSPEEAEQYVAVTIITTLLTALVGAKLNSMAKKGAENDAAYFQMSSADRNAYDRGQSLVSGRVWNKLTSLGLGGQTPEDVVARGRYLQENYRGALRVLVDLEGVLSLVNNSVPGAPGLGVGEWLDTGFTPAIRAIYGESAGAVLAGVFAGMGTATDYMFGD